MPTYRTVTPNPAPHYGIGGRPVWQWLLGLYLVGFLLQLFIGIENSLSLAFTPATAFSKPWTWVTSLFMHGSFFHLFFNAFALLMFAPLLEQIIGSKRFLLNYLAAGLIGNFFFFLFNPVSLVPGLGASGAIFGVLGALAMLEPHLVVFVYFIPLPMWIASIFWAFIELAGSLGPASGIGHSAHLGGLFFGLAYAWYLRNYYDRIPVALRNAGRNAARHGRQTLYPGTSRAAHDEEPIVFIDPNEKK